MGFSNVYGVPGVGALDRARRGALLDGRAAAEALRADVAAGVAARVAGGAPAPGLATVLVGDDPASHVYVAAKHRACAAVGIRSLDYRVAADVTPAALAALIERLNDDGDVDGILLQLPLPAHLRASDFVDLVDPRKDVDGLTTFNTGLLTQGRPALAPCTPLGVVALLDRNGVELRGADAVVVGRSQLVGRPLAAMLLARDATVTVCHRHTVDLAGVCRAADVLVAAIGVPRALGPDHVRPGAVVVDVGINRTADGLVGDVDFDAVRGQAAAITPVPGGVGPMTIAALMANTLAAAQARTLAST